MVMIAFTKDNWETSSLGIGSFKDKNFDGLQYGVVAPNIVGTVLAGKNLVIESEKQSGGVAQFKMDASGCYLNNSQFLLSGSDGDGKNLPQVALDPHFGLAIGKSGLPLYSVDDKGVPTLIKDNANLFTDDEGNLTMSGIIFASAGVFSGTVKASRYLDLNGKDMFVDGKFTSDYLDLMGINVKNGNGNTVFVIDENGIKWGKDGTNSDPKTDSAYNMADSANDKANDNTREFNKLTKTIDYTDINQLSIKSPTITGGLINGGEFRAIGNLKSTTTGKSEVGIYASYTNEKDFDKYGSIRYDYDPTASGNDNKERMFITTENNKALKIQSDGNMSLQAGGKDNKGTIYINSDVLFGKSPRGVHATFA